MSPHRPIADALLERYLAGDLKPEQRQAIEAALQASATERARLEDLRADNRAFFIKHPVGPVVAKLEAPPQSRWILRWLPAFVAAAAMVLAGVFALNAKESDWTAKGTIALTVHRKTASGSEKLADGAVTHPGDEVRFELRVPTEGFVAILSKDGIGQVSVYYPVGGQIAAAYRPNQSMLPAATQLDSALGRERVFAVYGASEFALQPLLEAVRANQPFPSGLVVSELQWIKQ